jgi:hypothetical protein
MIRWMRGWELIQGLTSRIIADDPQAFAREILEKAAACLGARRAAIFQQSPHWLGLFASRSVHQRVLDLVEWLWRTERARLESGSPYLASSDERLVPPEVQAVLTEGTTALLVLPIQASGRLAGLLYMDGGMALTPDLVDGARALAEIAAAALRTPAPPAPSAAPAGSALRASSDEVLREQLLQVLEENEWNIARVARLMGLSRVTIYNRLARYELERKKVPKGAVALRQLTEPR